MRQKFYTNKQSGFSLIEVLIALAVLAIALFAIMKVIISSINTTNYLQQKMIANWVADDAIASIQLGLIATPVSNAQMRMFNQNWYWSADEEAINSQVNLLTVTIRKSPSTAPLMKLEAFTHIVTA